jgi:hypothetical protein
MISTPLCASNMDLDLFASCTSLKEYGVKPRARYLRELPGKTVIYLDRIEILVFRSKLLNE